MNPSLALRQRLSRAWRYSVQLARRVIGVPDYHTYLAHLREHHPERTATAPTSSCAWTTVMARMTC